MNLTKILSRATVLLSSVKFYKINLTKFIQVSACENNKNSEK